MKLAIIGSRNFTPLTLVDYQFNQIMSVWKQKPTELEIVSGGASGPDTKAFLISKMYGFKYTPFYPKYELYKSHSALFERNTEIVQYSDCVWAFWNGDYSKGGTRDVMLKSLFFQKSLCVFYQDGTWHEGYHIKSSNALHDLKLHNV